VWPHHRRGDPRQRCAGTPKLGRFTDIIDTSPPLGALWLIRSGARRSHFAVAELQYAYSVTPIRKLRLAANWFYFPRAHPAPGRVAVRRHHVFVLEADLGGGVWRVYDANSGHHLTRVHARSIAGFTIVDPSG
jgi:hypothetical protein